MLSSAEALSWYLDGARVGVAFNGQPVLAAVVTGDSDVLYCYANEVERMLREELPAGASVEPVAWHEPLLGTAFAPGTRGVVHEPEVLPELRAARARLLPRELERYRALTREVAAAFTDMLALAVPAETERELAARLSRGIVELGADPLVVLVAGRSRLALRHPLPTGAAIGDTVMVVACARRHGLYANLTRWVRFRDPNPQERDAESRLLEVEADAFDATKPGRELAAMLSDIAAAYPRHGFDPGEWLRHHQGGPTGYAGRDPRATPHTTDLVVDGQPFAWNPTASGVKVEDTVLAAANGIEVLTADPRWPVVDVRGRARPIALQQ